MNLRLPAPLPYFDRENEAQTRRAIEQALAAFGTQGVSFFSELEAETLDVSGDVAVGGDLRVTGEVFVGSNPGTGLGGYQNIVVKGGAGGNLDLTDSSGTVRATVSTDNSGGNALFIDTRTNHPIVFRVNVTERMRLRGEGLYVVDDLQVGNVSRPAWVTSTRVTSDTATWTSVLPSGGFVTGLFMIRDATNGGSALIYGDVNNGLSVISSMPSGSTVLVTGAPAATQIGVRLSGSDIQVLAGSSRDGALIDTAFIASKL